MAYRVWVLVVSLPLGDDDLVVLVGGDIDGLSQNQSYFRFPTLVDRSLHTLALARPEYFWECRLVRFPWVRQYSPYFNIICLQLHSGPLIPSNSRLCFRVGPTLVSISFPSLLPYILLPGLVPLSRVHYDPHNPQTFLRW